MAIPELEVMKLRSFMEQRIPDLTIVYKDEKGWQWTNAYTFIAWAFFCGVGAAEWVLRKLAFLLSFWSVISDWRKTTTMRDRFNQNYSNGLNGNTLVFPSRDGFVTKEGRQVRGYSDWREPATYQIVRHELIHLLDQLKHPVWFPVSYVLLLPVVLTMRAHWELRGYTGTMLAYYDHYGTVPDWLLDNLEDIFTSAMYFWMYPFPNRMRRKLVNVRERIYSGDITGFYF